MINQPINLIGKVILAAAGCGDPELITVKAAKFLQQADVVLTDRLVSEQIINAYVKKSAEVVYVGKQHNNAASVSQQLINELIVKYAKQNKLVVRLKGGDVAFFSNVLDELETLIANQIPFEIVPGITAASGAATYAGIPLTARGYSTSVRMLTYYKQTIFSESLWAELAATDDTLVFYMSSENVTAIVNYLTKNGIANDKLLAIVQQATTPAQKVEVYNLYSFNTLEQAPVLASPTLLIIGRVVALHHTFCWQNNGDENIAYFKQIEKETA
jgi:uroporphyrin-III C-methyltransferase